MKRILSICLVALAMSACQSQSATNENANFPSPEVTPLNSSDQTNSASERPAMNPAHGQPYHDCSIAVGAPLVAKPAVQSNGPTKLNPAHGQPGHRCDIAVGAPLT